MKTYTLEEIKELCEKVSPSPWRGDFKCDTQKHEIYSGIYQTSHKIADVINYPRDFLTKEVEKADFEFIAASRTIVPQLVGQLEKAIKTFKDIRDFGLGKFKGTLDAKLAHSILMADLTLKELGVE